MSNYSKIYWLTRLDNINILFGVLAALSVIFLMFYYINGYIECNDQEEIKEYKSNYGKFSTIAFWVLIPCILIVIFLGIHTSDKIDDFLSEESDEEIDFTIMEEWGENTDTFVGMDNITFQDDLPEGINEQELRQQILDEFEKI